MQEIKLVITIQVPDGVKVDAKVEQATVESAETENSEPETDGVKIEDVKEALLAAVERVGKKKALSVFHGWQVSRVSELSETSYADVIEQFNTLTA